MKVRFYAVETKAGEQEIAAAMVEGCRLLGDECEVVPASSYVEPDPTVQMACAFALKGHAKAILDGYRAMGLRTLLVDKGMTRASTGLGGPRGYFRIALDEFMPLGRIMRERRPAERWIATGIQPHRRRKLRGNGPVVYAGSSQKYSDFHGLGDAQEYARDIIWRIAKQRIERPIIYRPKPSWQGASPIRGAGFSRPPETLGELLKTAHCVVTHGSHAGIDAIVAGVPAIVLGPGAARPVSATTIEALRGTLPFPTDEERFYWMAALGWWQWRVEEIADGSMWRFLREEMEKPAE